MNCGQCAGIEEVFNNKTAVKDIKRYRKKGAGKSTQRLINALIRHKEDGLSLLDIGGGIGAIQNELLKGGLDKVISVDASEAYLKIAKSEAERQGHLEKIQYYHGDLVEVAKNIEAADIVTLDKVVCCYDDVDGILSQSLQKANKYYGIIFPKDSWPGELLPLIGNLYFKIRGIPFRAYLHSVKHIEDVVSSAGFERVFYHRSFIWLIALYRKLPQK